MAARLWSRLAGRGDDGEATLAAALKRATESNLYEMHDDLLTPIADASCSEEGRQEIMRHLQQCLAENSGSKWLRVYAGLAVVADLLKRGSPLIFVEAAEGRHFDLVQRLSFLEGFQHTDDKRAEKLVRNKAGPLRAQVVARLQEASAAESVGEDTESTGSPGVASIASMSTAASFLPAKPKTPNIISGIVTVGHCDDTTSESSDGEASKPARLHNKTRKTVRERRHKTSSGSSSDSDGPSAKHPGARAPAPALAAAPSVDLLDF